MNRTATVFVALAISSAACSKKASEEAEPAAKVSTETPRTPDAPATDDSAKVAEDTKKVANRLAEFEAAHAEEAKRWTDEVKAAATKLASSSFKDTKGALAAILESPHRSPANRARDAHRHPAETLAFFGIEPTMTVVELGAGAGWYTEILAPLLAAKGKLRVSSASPDGPPTEMSTAYAKRFALWQSLSPDLYGKIEVVYSDPSKLSFGEPGTADMALAMREMHGWYNRKAVEAYLAAVHEVLKDGGIFGVVQHRGPEGTSPEDTAEKGYLPQQWVIDTVVAAGFTLVEPSEINANPKDTKDHPEGVWTLPPSYRLGDKDRAKYEAIGESDRMTLKFKKVARPGAAAEKAASE